MPNFRQRKWLFLGIAIAIVVLITLVAAPNSGNSKSSGGSTYSKTPYGYGAWYEYMGQKEVAVDRWRKPFNRLIEAEITNVTYLRVLSQENYIAGIPELLPSESQWVGWGNTLVILGKYQPATNAPFKSSLPYRRGGLASSQIEIATTRRLNQPQKQKEKILADRYGTVVWSEQIGKGKVIYCTTPYLAANAYQNNPDNFQFLAELVSQHPTVWIDEYIHGYRDKETAMGEQKASLLDYLIQTPWFLLFIQTVLIAIVAAVATLRRFGQPVKPSMTIADNSTAYIEALAAVLAKANSSEFAIETIAKDERLKLQQALGLGKSLVDSETLLAAYGQQPESANLRRLLDSKTQPKISASQLIEWIQQWRKINRH